MKKIITLSLLLGTTIMLSNSQSLTNCGNLFFSEYIEGTQMNKALEVYNPKGTPVNLNIYTIKVYKNGTVNNPTVIALSGILPPKGVHTCGHPQSEAAIFTKCDITNNGFDFSGDDAVGLYRNDTLIDLIGEIGINPNGGFTVGTGSTKDFTLIRKFDIRGGTPFWSQSVFEWEVFPKDNSTDLGSHNSITGEEDRHILANFQDPFITNAEVNAFAQRNDLILMHEPDANLPKGSYSWSYVFEIGPAKCSMDPNTSAALIQINESAIVRTVSASTTKFNWDVCLTVNEMNLDTVNPDRLWQIQNTGNVVANNLSGTNNADAEVCECWDAGFTGNGIKVAMLDGGGFEFTHEDMLGKFLDGWNFYTNDTLNGTFIDLGSPAIAHAMTTSGLVAANAGNDTGIAGVAFNSTIIPILLINPSPTYTVPGVQKAVDFGADVINMSLSGPFNQNLNDEIVLATQTGRGGLGCIVVGSSGNFNDSTFLFYPAAQDEVIGVGASNPDDFRSWQNDGWGCWGAGQGSNFGSFYEVVGPGTNLALVDFMGTGGFNTSPSPAGNYHFSCGTSYSAPIVSGICAILLEKNPTWTWDNVKDAIINGADKVHSADTGGIYDYNFDPLNPGKSFEMGYGRVNCLNSLNFVVGIDESIDNQLFDLVQVYNNNDKLIVIRELRNKEDMIIKIFDMLGRELTSHLLPSNQNRTEISVSQFTRGIYLAGVYKGQGNIVKSQKFIKY